MACFDLLVGSSRGNRALTIGGIIHYDLVQCGSAGGAAHGFSMLRRAISNPVNLYDIELTTLDARRQSMADYRGQVLLVVNVASQCGFTLQYAGLEKLYRRFQAQRFTVLGFPCDQFGHQEPGGAEDIQQFCSTKFDVTFPLFAKVEVNGPREHPLFTYLKSRRRGLLWSKAIKWNFTKFLIDRQGNIVRRYGTAIKPERIEKDIAALL